MEHLVTAGLTFFELERLSAFSVDVFGFLNLMRHVVGLVWTRDQLIAKTSTDTGQHNI
jgi:hypothetical protein